MLTGGADRIRVLIADDHPIMRDGIAVALESSPDMDVVGQAADGAEPSSAFASCAPTWP